MRTRSSGLSVWLTAFTLFCGCSRGGALEQPVANEPAPPVAERIPHELGRSWYESGKLLNKRNTFTDFIDCAEFLITRGYAEMSAGHGGKPGRLERYEETALEWAFLLDLAGRAG